MWVVSQTHLFPESFYRVFEAFHSEPMHIDKSTLTPLQPGSRCDCAPSLLMQASSRYLNYSQQSHELFGYYHPVRFVQSTVSTSQGFIIKLS